MQDDLIQECQNVILVDVWNDCAGKVMGARMIFCSSVVRGSTREK